MKILNFICFIFLPILLPSQNRVGVNTNTPLNELDVRSLSDDDGADINIGNLSNTHFLRLFSGKSSNDFPDPTIYWNDGDALLFGSFGQSFTEHLRISSNSHLILNGRLKVGDTFALPELGEIRYNADNNDFEGYNGQWVSLTGNNQSNDPSVIYDIDGNAYKTINIGARTWMRENLKVTKFNDGTPIPEKLFDFIDIGNVEEFAWCWYGNDERFDKPYGKLYNHYVVDSSFNGGRNVCPTGWHVPSWDEFTALLNAVGFPFDPWASSLSSSGNVEEGTGLWIGTNTGIGTNLSGFNGMPGGLRAANTFNDIGERGFYWSRTNIATNSAMFLDLWPPYDNTSYNPIWVSKINGLSIRCVKEN